MGKVMRMGRVLVNPGLILTWLQLDEGHIWDVKFDKELQIVSFLVSHPDFPEKPENEYAKIINLSYTTYQDNIGNAVVIRNPIAKG